MPKEIEVLHVYREALENWVYTIQEDAFESGRLLGRVEEMNRFARLVEDELPMTAESFRKWARELESTPPATKSDVE